MPVDKNRKHTPCRQKRGEIPSTGYIAVLRRIVLEALLQRRTGLAAERNGGEGFAAGEINANKWRAVHAYSHDEVASRVEHGETHREVAALRSCHCDVDKLHCLLDTQRIACKRRRCLPRLSRVGGANVAQKNEACRTQQCG